MVYTAILIFLVAIKDIEGSEIPEDTLKIINVAEISEDVMIPLYAGILQLLKLAFRPPCGTLKQDVFQKDLLDLK